MGNEAENSMLTSRAYATVAEGYSNGLGLRVKCLKRAYQVALYLSFALVASACSSCRDDPYTPPDELPVKPAGNVHSSPLTD